MCRVYILEGVNIAKPSDANEKPNSYLVVKIGSEIKKDVTRSLRKETHRPEFFVMYDFVIEIPGCSNLKVELWHKNDIIADEFMGSTKIDLESRHFNESWAQYNKRPIEYRSLTNKSSKAAYGRISMWIDLDPVIIRPPIYEISPVEKVHCELRVIVWEARDFKANDEVSFFHQKTNCY